VTPSNDDLDAKTEIDTNTKAAVTNAAKSAESWLKAIAGLTGLLATAAIVKGPSESTKIDEKTLDVVVGAMVVGFIALAAATWLLYAAAYGKPGELNKIKTSPTAGLAGRLATQRDTTLRAVLWRIRFGMNLAMIGVVVLFVAALVVVVPKSTSGSDESDTVCVLVDGESVLTVNAASLDVVELSSGTSIGEC
jgi:hypothetical protein